MPQLMPPQAATIVTPMTSSMKTNQIDSNIFGAMTDQIMMADFGTNL